MSTVAFIPVRGGSKSIPLKNIKDLAGRPLVHWTMQAALDCPCIDRLFVASESQAVREVVGRLRHPKLTVIGRSHETATDAATTESALIEFAEGREFDTVVLIQATSPLLTAADLTAALEAFGSGSADAMLSVVREHRFLWRPREDGAVAPLNYSPLARPRRQEWGGELIENGAFYITARSALLESRCRVSGRIIAHEMSPENALELDEPADWALAEQRLSGRAVAPAGLAARCRRIEALVTDVDGVLTDAGVFVGADGELCKRFSVRDGMGLALWHDAGLRSAIMTREETPFVTQRAAKLKIQTVLLGERDKGEALTRYLAREGLQPEQVLFIGDDINDLPALSRVGLAACPADAADPVRAVAHYVSRAAGGHGAVREIIDFVLSHRAP